MIWLLDSGRAIPQAGDHGFIVYGVVSNITARKRVKVELAEAHAQALETSHLKTQLLANVSHDRRTPLTA